MNRISEMAARLAAEPPFRHLTKAALKLVGAAPSLRARWDISKRPQYLLGLVTAARQARLQGAAGFCAIEFGVGEVLQELAVQEFHLHANLRTVSGDASVFASAYWLEIEITDFQAEYTSAATAPTVRVSLRARLGSSGDRHLVGQFAATVQKPAAENRLSSIVDAFAGAADASLAEIAAQAGEKLARVSETR